MTEIIKYNNKEYKMPFDADYSRQKADSFKEEIIVNNRFNNEPAMLPWFAVAVYDVIMGSEQMQDWDNHRKGLDWFIKYFPKQYSVLLDQSSCRGANAPRLYTFNSIEVPTPIQTNSENKKALPL